MSGATIINLRKEHLTHKIAPRSTIDVPHTIAAPHNHTSRDCTSQDQYQTCFHQDYLTNHSSKGIPPYRFPHKLSYLSNSTNTLIKIQEKKHPRSQYILRNHSFKLELRSTLRTQETIS